jgi:NADPH:quinone reductase-like Zn-dependent oxidoreductase
MLPLQPSAAEFYQFMHQTSAPPQQARPERAALGRLGHIAGALRPAPASTAPPPPHNTGGSQLLPGKVVVVTGAGGGLGEGIAKVAHREGAWVVLADHDAAGLARVAAELGDDRVLTQASHGW